MSENIDKLLYGKSGLKRVVGLEIEDSNAIAFIQDEDGIVRTECLPHRFWILSNTQIDRKFHKLAGELHYCYGKQYVDRKEWMRDRSIYRNTGEDTYSIYDNVEAMMVKDGITFYRDMKLKEVSLLSFDLETTGLDGKAKDAQVLLISTTFRDIHGQVNRLFSYDEYENEGQLIGAFCDYVREKNPSLLVGHNIITYDFVYLRDRAAANDASLKLGRNDSEVKFDSYESKLRMDGTRDLLYYNLKVYGREVVDTFMLAISFDVSKSMETYALKPLIKQLGFEKEGRQFYDAANIRKNYKDPGEWEKIKQYSIDDAEDPLKLFDYMGPLYFNMASMMTKPFSKVLLSASGSKINGMLVRAYLQDGHSIPKADQVRKFQGALSWGQPGIYRNVRKVDAVSLYPSVIIQYSVFDIDKDPKAYLLELVKIFRAKRLEYKKLAVETGDSYWKEMDTTAKGILNSFFGFFGCPGLNFNSFECAEFITATGREILETAITWATSKKFKDLAPEYYEQDSEGQEVL